MNEKNNYSTLHFAFRVIKVLLITVQQSSKVMQKLLQSLEFVMRNFVDTLYFLCP